MKMMITIIEFPSFLSRIGKSISTDERDDFINFLAKHPAAGDEIPGTGGVRKIRWGGNNKGKRVGVRIIYYLLFIIYYLLFIIFIMKVRLFFY